MGWSAARKGDAVLGNDQDGSGAVQSSPSSGSSGGESSPERLPPVKLTTRSKKKVKRHSPPPSSDPAKLSSPEKTIRSKKKLKSVTELEDPDALRSHALEIAGGEDIIEAILFASTASAGEHIALGDAEPGEGSAAEQLPSPQADTPDMGTGDEEDQMAHAVKPPVEITVAEEGEVDPAEEEFFQEQAGYEEF